MPHGAFPDYPSQQGKTRDDDDWDSAWKKYYDDPSLGDYQGQPGRAYRGDSNCYDPNHCFELCYPRYPDNDYAPGRPYDRDEDWEDEDHPDEPEDDADSDDGNADDDADSGSDEDSADEDDSADDQESADDQASADDQDQDSNDEVVS